VSLCVFRASSQKKISILHDIISIFIHFITLHRPKLLSVLSITTVLPVVKIGTRRLLEGTTEERNVTFPLQSVCRGEDETAAARRVELLCGAK
jgi:hypothetical protein